MFLFRRSDCRTHAVEEKCCCGVFVFDAELQMSHLTPTRTTLHFNMSAFTQV